ncbi:MAG: T9SS C-terminal target domain-containing protein [Thermonemataceae bacterium]
MAWKVQAQEIILKGVYQGKNLYVQNPLAANKSSFCTKEVFVNNRKVLSSPKSSSFEIDLSYLKLNQGVTIKILYVAGCKPKVINARAIQPSAAFQFTQFKVEADRIVWHAKGESASSAYYVEKFVNNNWRNIKTVIGAQAGAYAIQAKHTAGLNKYRVKYGERNGKIYYTQAIIYRANNVEIKFYPKNVNTKIYFTAVVAYEILDANGKLLKKGTAKQVNASDLKRGIYYLNLDGRTEKFLKK